MPAGCHFRPDDGLLEALDERRQPLERDLHLCRLAGITRVAALRPCVEMDVGAETQPQAGPTGQQRRRQVKRDAVELVAEHPAHPDVAPGHERERRQEVLAELLVRDPGHAGRVALEREVVDEHRLDAPELDVVGGGILERPALRQRRRLDLERQQARRP